jgi:two-component sensor histidine kinase
MAAARFLKRFAEHEPGAIGAIAGALAFVAAPSGVALLLGFAFGETPCFALFFPAILLAALLLGWRVGLLVALLSAISSQHLLANAPMSMAMTKHGLLTAGEYWLSAGLILVTAALLRNAFVQLNAAAERERALNHELRHRVNNGLALALAFASQTIRSAPEPEVFYASFRSRLMALARAQDILSSGDWADCQFPKLAETALEAFDQRNAISLSGDACSVPSASCVPLVLALHELATNAVKHGALSVPGGRVSLNWSTGGADGSQVVLRWVESGGPTVEPPSRHGLGSRLLVRQSGLDEVSTEYDPAGLRCTMVVRGTSCKRATTSTRSDPRVLASA